MTSSAPRVELDLPVASRGRRRWAGAVIVTLVVALPLAFLAGSRWGGATQSAFAYCSVVADFISCGDQPGLSEYIGGKYVHWTEDGATHEGRPSCLDGFDRVVRVEIWYESVSVGGVRTRQIVGVDCDTVTGG